MRCTKVLTDFIQLEKELSREDYEEFKNPVDLMFDALEAEKPNHFAVRQYKKYKLAAGRRMYWQLRRNVIILLLFLQTIMNFEMEKR